MNIRSQICGVAPSAESPLVLTKRPKGVQANDLTTIPVSRETGRCGDTRMGERPLMVIEPAQTRDGSAYDVQVINRAQAAR